MLYGKKLGSKKKLNSFIADYFAALAVFFFFFSIHALNIKHTSPALDSYKK